mgnify:CR=1 FL=1
MVSSDINYIACQHAYVAFDKHVNIVMLHGDINYLAGDRSMPPFIRFVISVWLKLFSFF